MDNCKLGTMAASDKSQYMMRIENTKEAAAYLKERLNFLRNKLRPCLDIKPKNAPDQAQGLVGGRALSPSPNVIDDLEFLQSSINSSINEINSLIEEIIF